MWVRLRRTLGLWLLQDDAPAAKAPRVTAPVAMSMEDAGNENVQKAQGTSGPVQLSMKGVGSGNTQVASAEEVTIQIPPQSPPGPVTNMTTHVHNHHYYGATGATPAPAVELDAKTPSAKPTPKLPPVLASSSSAKSGTTPEQRQLLALMEPLDRQTRIGVLDFMRENFRTGMVLDLKPSEVRVTRWYVQQMCDDSTPRQRA